MCSIFLQTYITVCTLGGVQPDLAVTHLNTLKTADDDLMDLPAFFMDPP